MSRILFISIPEKGHLNPMIAPAAHLRDRGHTVAFFAGRNVSDQVRRAGLDVVPEMLEQPLPVPENRGDLFARQVRDREWLRLWIRELLVNQAEEQIEPLRHVIRNFRPDVVVTDPMIYAAVIASHHEGRRWVALSNSLNPVLDESIRSELLDTVTWLAPERQQLFARHGLTLPFRGCDALSPWLTVAFTTEEFIGRSAPGVHLLGPSVPAGMRGDEVDFPWHKLREDVPLVYLSFGSQIYYQPEIFRRVIEATRELGVQLVIAAQQLHASPELAELPDHVLACGYAPQLQLLPRTKIFITHGGANSVMEAIRFNVPLLISPVCNDQFHQAHFVNQSGIGLVLDLLGATTNECRDALKKLLGDPGFPQRMHRVSASYQRDGAEEAAALIEKLT